MKKQVGTDLVRERLALYNGDFSFRFQFVDPYFESVTATTAPELAASLFYIQLEQ